MNEEEIFHEALARNLPEERAAYLDQACAGNTTVRAAVEALLRANVGATGFLGNPVSPLTRDEPMTETPGTMIGPYKLLQQIGEGGMGVVWMAEQTQPVQRKVALKLATFQLQNADRIREVTQSVRQSFTGVRTAITAGDLTLATQQLAEAQGRLSNDRTMLPELAAEYDRLHQEIEARRADEARFQRFLKLSSDGQDKMSFNNRLGGDLLAEEALGLYAVLTADDWLSRLENSYLTAGKRAGP